MARLRVGGAVASTPVAPRLRVGGVIASGPAIPPRLRVGGVIASGEPAPTGTFRRVHGGTWQPGWFMPGQVMRRVHPDTTWYPISSTPAPVVPTPVLGRLRVGGAVASGPALVPGTGLPAHVIVGALQSNVRGAATDWDQSDQFNNPLIEMYRWSDGLIVEATEPLSTRDTATGMGALNTFVKSYAADHPGQRIIVLNTARGGTGLTTPSTNPAGTAFTWDPDAVNDANNLARTSVATINSLMSTLPEGSKIVAYIANHGSTDGVNLGNTGTTKDTFKSLFTRWLNYLRTQTNTANVPYLMLQMRPSLLAEARHNLIDQAQQEIAAVTPGVEHVPSPVGSEYAMPDSVHFNARGVREIGNRLYQRFSSISSPPESPQVAPRAGITVTEWARPTGALDANPSNFKSVLAGAPSGATLCLAPGTYPGDWRITKPVTIQPAPSALGAKVIVDGQNAATPAGIVSARATIRGITFRNFNTQDATKWEHGLMFPSGSSGSVVEHCRFEDFKGTSGNFTRGAIVIFNRGAITIRHCESVRMDQGHLSGNLTNGMVVENCYFADSNLVPGSSDTSGGMKFTRAENAIIRNNVIEKLNAKVAAIWFDVYCVGCQIVNNSINAPGSHAYVFVELCHDFIVAGNTCFGGSQFGIWIFDSSKVRAWNNDVKQSTSWQIGIMQDDRRNDGSEGDARANATSYDNEAVNNVLAADYELFQIYAMDDYHTGYTPEFTAEQMWKRIEGNVMPRNTTRGSQVGWGRLGRQRESLTLEQLETRFPQVARNNRVPVQVPLPADIAASLGVAPGTVGVGPLTPAPVRA